MGISSKKNLFKQHFDFLRYSPLLLLWYGFLLTVVLVVKINAAENFVPGWDPSHHMLMGLKYHYSLINKDANFLSHLYFDSQQMYPPLYHTLIALCFELFGISSKSGIYANIPFIFILIFATYNFGALISKKVGLISALLTPLLPIFLSLSESALLDYASISLFILSYYLLFKTDYFTHRKYVLLFGFVILLNLLTKWSFLAPAITFIFYYVISLIKSKNKVRILLSSLVVVLITLPGLIWIISHTKYIIGTLTHYGSETNYPQLMWKSPSGFNLKNIMLYAYTFPVSYMGMGIAMLVSTYFGFFKTNKSVIEKYLIASIVLTYFILTSMSDKAEKYIAYIYPLAIILSVSWIESFKKTSFKRVLQITMYGSVLANIVAINIPQLRAINIDLILNIYGQKHAVIMLPKYLSTLEDDGWPTEKIIQNYIPSGGEKKTLLTLVDHKRANASTLKFLAIIHDKNVEVTAGYEIVDPTHNIAGKIDDLIKYDYILTKSGGIGVFANSFTVDTKNKLLTNSPNFVLIAEEPTPTGNKIFLFKTIPII